jgi:hypothetical protein
MQLNQQITFFSDGGDTVRSLQLYLNPEAVRRQLSCPVRRQLS